MIRIFCYSLVGIFFVSFPINAQQHKKIPRIGYLSSLSLADDSTGIGSFKRGLRAFGHVDGKNIVIEYRFANRNFRRLLKFADELVSLKVDVIVTPSPTPTRAARSATSSIPIVMAQDSDPVGNGFVESLTRPGGNITGLSTLLPVMSGKQLAILKEIIPKLSRVAVIATPINPDDTQARKDMEAAALAFNATLQHLELRSPNGLEAVFQEAINGRADAVIVLQSPLVFSRPVQVAEIAAKSRLPAMYPAAEFVQAGGLMGYGADLDDLFRRAAGYVDTILKGSKPGNLPVQQPTKLQLIINLKAAKQIGLTIPQKVLQRADRVIK
jgi:putative ABC transport system substrate-binding protein